MILLHSSPSGWALGLCNTSIISFSVVLLKTCCCVWDHRPAARTSFGQALAVAHIWLQNTLVNRGLHGRVNDCNLPRSCGCKTNPNLVFAFCYKWPRPQWPKTSPLCSRSPVIFFLSDATLQKSLLYDLCRDPKLSQETLPDKPGFSLILLVLSWALTFSVLQ